MIIPNMAKMFQTTNQLLYITTKASTSAPKTPKPGLGLPEIGLVLHEGHPIFSGPWVSMGPLYRWMITRGTPIYGNPQIYIIYITYIFSWY